MQYTESSFQTPVLHVQLSSMPIFNQINQPSVPCAKGEEERLSLVCRSGGCLEVDLCCCQELLLQLPVFVVGRTVGIL
jgi:hypothetical protein